MSAKPKTSIETPWLVVRPISVGAVNWIGISTLYVKEVMRFLKVPVQTLFGPAMTATLFMMVFAVAVGERISLCLLYTSPSPRDRQKSRMPSSA